MPLLQLPLQHCAPIEHIPPLGVQGGLPHTPLVQTPVQHSAPLEHIRPSGLHCPLPHTPLVQTPVQHCEPVEHVPPSSVQVEQLGSPQIVATSFTQMPSHPMVQQKLST